MSNAPETPPAATPPRRPFYAALLSTAVVLTLAAAVTYAWPTPDEPESKKAACSAPRHAAEAHLREWNRTKSADPSHALHEARLRARIVTESSACFHPEDAALAEQLLNPTPAPS